MQIKDLIPWARSDKAPETKDREANPIAALQEDMNRIFDNFWNQTGRPFNGVGALWNGTTPRSDVIETDDGLEVTVELPGMAQNDVEVTLTDDMLTVKGEKKIEHQEKKKGYFVSERSYGAFHRSIPLPVGVDTAKAEAIFKNGVLTVKLPQSPEAKAKTKRIEVKAA
jgi:HSP20 family protein